MSQSSFDEQFSLARDHYLDNLDMVTWVRHYHVLRDLLGRDSGDVLEIGTGDGIVRRCAEPFVTSYTVLDVNPKLDPEVLGDIRDPHKKLAGRFDTIIAAEIMEHLPFADVPICLENIRTWLRPGGRALVSLPHRKSTMTVLTPKQRLMTFRFPNGAGSLSEFYNRFIRRRIWIDPNHVWEIGDGRVRLAEVERLFDLAGLLQQRRLHLPYSDYWILTKALATNVDDRPGV